VLIIHSSWGSQLVGDLYINTVRITFFHQFASARRKKNLIKKLKHGEDWVEGASALKPIILEYFSGLCTSEVNAVDPAVMEKVQRKVTAEMNEKLLAPFSAEDVKKVAFSIGDMKAPGPDGIHAFFYKRFWSLCGEDITNEVLQAMNTGIIPDGWNDTTVVLIPKIDCPESVTQYRPISLCNVIYKIISKMLAQRLKVILPEVISPMQSAFVPGRLITDNVLLAYKSIYAIKNKRVGLSGACAVKLDMHKAYDRVEWIFLENMMRRLGFEERWISLMMACVSSVRYQVRFNSDETDMFTPTRGLRQGGPLSPYLFLLCAEGLSSLLLFEEEVGGIAGVRVCRNAPSVSLLLFADDSLILMKADTNNATSLQQVLDIYCANSGQMVSLVKLSIFFSPNTNVLARAEICEALHITTEAISDKYLGLSALVGADRSDCFEHFIERIIQRINGWKEKQLSIGGKEILLKAIAQAIPVYAMSVFLIPKGICKRMMDAISSFWWGMMKTAIRCIGMHGGSYVTRNVMKVWAPEISTLLILLCWLSRFGD
jgi:hypothetical protein